MQRKIAPAVLALVALASCARSGDAGGGEPAGPSFPVTVAGVTIPERPVRIVSLSPTHTEMLFAVGAGEQVVAVDDQSNFPPEAPRTELSGYEPNVEAIAAQQPDLVVFSTEPGGLADALRELDIAAVQMDAAETVNDTYAQIRDVGRATGREAEASALVESMRSQIAEIASSLPERSPAPTYYHELDASFFTATSKTFIGSVYALAGLQNIADAVAEEGNQYPQLSAEFIVSADPDLIFLADTKCCGQSLETVAKRPGWSSISAVKSGSVVALDDDVASRWGPRVVDHLRAVAGALRGLEAAA